MPLLVLVLGAVLVILLIVGLIKLAVGGSNDNTIPLDVVDTQQTEPPMQADALLTPAKLLASQYDYDGAISLLHEYTGTDTRVQSAIDEYTAAKAALVKWADNTTISHISFQNLIVDTERAFDGDSAAADYADYNLTVSEFQKALEQMYEKGYVLVDMENIAAADASGKYAAQDILLPAGKTPLVMSMLPVSFSLDKAGDGFARKLVVQDDGTIAAEYIDPTATRQYGAYDFVSVLEDFISQHPDFSYRGARAILGINGSGDPFGYSLNDEEQVTQLKAVISCLRATGYTFASFTYDGIRYGDAKDTEVASDVKAWKDTFGELFGDVKILIYAGGSDLLEYEGNKYNTLYAAGFRYFIGINNSAASSCQITDAYVRQDRRTINGVRITEGAKLISDLFDAGKILDPARP